MSEPGNSKPEDKENGGSGAGKPDVPWADQAGSSSEKSDSAKQEEAEDSQQRASNSKEGAAAAAGFLRVWCPKCEQEMNISREHMGMQGLCPKCDLPIVAKMVPKETGGMKVVAAEVLIAKGDSPVPSWMKRSLGGETEENTSGQEGDPSGSAQNGEAEKVKVGKIVVEKTEAEKAGDEKAKAEKLKADIRAEMLKVEAAKSSESENAKTEEKKVGSDKADYESTSKDDEAGDKPSWAEGGNPWNALGLSEQKTDESADKEEGKQEKEEGKQEKEVKAGEPVDLEEKDSEEYSAGEEELEGEPEDEKESRLSLIAAVVIIVVVAGGGLIAYLNRDKESGNDQAAIEKVAANTNTNSNKSGDASGGDKPAINKAANNSSSGESVKTNGGDKPAIEKAVANSNKPGGEKVAGKVKDEGLGSTALGGGQEKVPGDDSNKSKQSNGSDMKTAAINSGTDKGKSEKDKESNAVAAGNPEVEKAEPKPRMATARASVNDDISLRIHQEGERAIRRFYRARSVEERSAFVVNPDRAMKSMRSFYEKLGQLPTIRYLEFIGMLQDPTSGLRFGVFDVHEKENEDSHRWCVVEIEPSQYALDWGFYEQLEGSTLMPYLSKAQDSPKNFRFLMKLGESVSAVDSPWDEESVKVFLQLPLAGGGGGEAILMKKSDAKEYGILKELADGQMKIGQVELNWISSDKDPGSKVPTITGVYGWGAWTKPKMRGLN